MLVIFTGIISYFFKLSLLPFHVTSTHHLLKMFLYGTQKVLLPFWHSMWEFQSPYTIGFTDAFIKVISSPSTIQPTILLQCYILIQVGKRISMICHRFWQNRNFILWSRYFFFGNSGANATFLEHLALSTVIGIPIIGSHMMGYGSRSMIYGYPLVFDFLRCLGHSNVEVVPLQLFETLPFLRYLLYTPT